ncbi:MAG: hypothetical protein NT090_19325 [Acidobacteria bacterium]|nr:hypothetical protein [Acidobacteriota bacterium]
MATASITIQVSEEAARAYAEVTPDERQKIQLLLDLQLRDLTTPPRKSLQTVMDELGAKAAARGLTPAALESLLNDG